jgi:hypothetical protein
MSMAIRPRAPGAVSYVGPWTSSGLVARIVAFAGMGLVGACRSHPVAVPPAAVAPAAAVASAASDIQCHTEAVTGSLLRTRVCLTKSQRDAQQVMTEQMKDALQNQPLVGCQNGGPPPCAH